VILTVLLLFLAGTASLAAALLAFIVSRACGKSVFRALTCAAATFVAAFTLALLTLTFVASAQQGHHAGGQVAQPRISSVTKNQGNGSMAIFVNLVTYV
jgi:hypothetical protein